jgi:beta-N-acetylhexosaminidase
MSDTQLRQTVASLLLVGFHGTTPADAGVKAVMDQLSRGMLAGVILFGYNIESSEQVAELSVALRRAAGNRPIFIAVDQEGGRVARFSQEKGFKHYSSAKGLGNEAGRIYDSSHSMADMLKHHGVNLNFAPCVDLDCDEEGLQCPVIGKLERSFSSAPGMVAECASQFIQGHHDTGVTTCLKHFPGHGRALTDSHKGLTDITGTWSSEELAPYRELIAAGNADMVMLAHLIHREHSEDPATLSSYWVNTLRDDLGFDGVIVTDDMHMGAITQNYGVLDSAVRSLKAGVDLLLFSNNPAAAQGVDFTIHHSLADQLTDGIVKAALAGELDSTLLAASELRIRGLLALS